ncbi:MAG: long-chain fatty acid transporter [Nevskiaceae bacterium]|nr:MAG: long-chain fatty acid transporter [Nevskiaceae bacterium]TBR75092.1 MAG: long-chain fatty acid transporter [Nevskiaceae bacterium]
MAMRGSRTALLCAAVTGAGLLTAGAANAADGYFAHGYGMQAAGRGGAAIAFTSDAFGGANNPATIAWVGNRFEVGLSVLQGIRGAKREGSVGGGIADYNETSDRHYFEVPEMAFSRQVSDRYGWGVAMYANGGMNTTYHDNTLPEAACDPSSTSMERNRNAFCGTGRLGLNLMQVIIAPTFAYKLTPKMSVGIAPLFGVQAWKLYGLDSFKPLSSAPDSLTNRGNDFAFGYGARVGYYYRPLPWLNLGAQYSTRVYMTPFSRYKGLFADAGRFDIPQNYGVGIMVSPVPELRIGLDWQRIDYSKVASNGNLPNVSPANLLGSHDGPGFHWSSVNAYKFGIEAWPESRVTLRFGYNHSTQVINRDAVTFNILAPGVAQDHVTVGFTWRFGKGSEINGYYLRWFSHSLAGPSILPFGGTETLRMHMNALGVGYAVSF